MYKKIILLLLISISVLYIYAQNCERGIRECVLIENFTGIKCSYCPGCAAGLNQMIEEGLPVAVIEYHTSAFSTPEYFTDETNERAGFYSISSYPTTFFDGILSHNGGELFPGNIYSTLMGYYNQRIGIPSPFNINIICNHISGFDYQAVATIIPAGNCVGNDLRIMMAYTQSNISQEWGNGMTQLNCVCRDMLPDQNGTAYVGGIQTVTENFNIKNYPSGDINLIVWIQDFNTKEVFQSVIIPIDYVYPAIDIKLCSVENIPKTSCSGVINPVITVKNVGTDDIHSFDIVAKINDIELSRYHWEKNTLKFLDCVTFTMPEFSFSIEDTVNIVFSTKNPNGFEDMNTDNDSKNVCIMPSPLCNDYFTLQFKTDDHPEEDVIQVVNITTGDTLDKIRYVQSNHVYSKRIYLPDISCYSFSVHDSGGDGISTYFSLRDKDNNLIFNGARNINPFANLISCEIHADEGENVSINDCFIKDNIIVIPNPAKDYIVIHGNEISRVDIYDSFGVTVLSSYDKTICVRNLSSGIYLMNIITKDMQRVIRKLIIE